MKEMHANDEDFKEIFAKCSNHAYGLSHVKEGFSFKDLTFVCLKAGLKSF